MALPDSAKPIGTRESQTLDSSLSEPIVTSQGLIRGLKANSEQRETDGLRNIYFIEFLRGYPLQNVGGMSAVEAAGGLGQLPHDQSLWPSGRKEAGRRPMSLFPICSRKLGMFCLGMTYVNSPAT